MYKFSNLLSGVFSGYSGAFPSLSLRGPRRVQTGSNSVHLSHDYQYNNHTKPANGNISTFLRCHANWLPRLVSRLKSDKVVAERPFGDST